MDGIVEKTIIWTHDTKTLFIRPKKPIHPVPGQFVMIGLEVDGKLVKRAYSVCSAPVSEHIEITFRITPDGKLSPRLFDLSEGDSLIIEGPYGNFRLDRSIGSAVLIAGGTGIAPLMSMIRQARNDGWKTSITLIYAVRDISNVLYREELEGYAAEGRLRFIAFTQDGNDLPSYFRRGRITEAVIKETVEKAHAHTYYLCGSPQMVSAIESMLKAIGVQKERIKTDKWD